jgi:hypothetical protein
LVLFVSSVSAIVPGPSDFTKKYREPAGVPEEWSLGLCPLPFTAPASARCAGLSAFADQLNDDCLRDQIWFRGRGKQAVSARLLAGSERSEFCSQAYAYGLI